MTEVVTRKVTDIKHIIDQPYFHVGEGAEETVLVGENDWRTYGATNKKTASVDGTNNTDGSQNFTVAALDPRNIEFDDASIRPAIAQDGTAYVAFISVKKWDGILFTADVVVSHDFASRQVVGWI